MTGQHPGAMWHLVDVQGHSKLPYLADALQAR